MAEVRETGEYDSSADEIWKRIGDFHGADTWHPAVEASERLADDRRSLTIAGGATIVESLVTQGERTYTYSIDESPLPVADYQATIAVRETDGGSAIDWTASFEPSGASEAEASEVIRGIFRAGLDSL